ALLGLDHVADRRGAVAFSHIQLQDGRAFDLPGPEAGRIAVEGVSRRAAFVDRGRSRQTGNGFQNAVGVVRIVSYAVGRKGVHVVGRVGRVADPAGTGAAGIGQVDGL